jgi:hypothetical protein
VSETPTCEICGEPMPPGEEMFKYHGLSGPCPKPPKAKEASAHVTIPRVQYEALMAARNALAHVYRDDGCGPESWNECREALAQCRAAGIPEETKP